MFPHCWLETGQLQAFELFSFPPVQSISLQECWNTAKIYAGRVCILAASILTELPLSSGKRNLQGPCKHGRHSESVLMSFCPEKQRQSSCLRHLTRRRWQETNVSSGHQHVSGPRALLVEKIPNPNMQRRPIQPFEMLVTPQSSLFSTHPIVPQMGKMFLLDDKRCVFTITGLFLQGSFSGKRAGGKHWALRKQSSRIGKVNIVHLCSEHREKLELLKQKDYLNSHKSKIKAMVSTAQSYRTVTSSPVLLYRMRGLDAVWPHSFLPMLLQETTPSVQDVVVAQIKKWNKKSTTTRHYCAQLDETRSAISKWAEERYSKNDAVVKSWACVLCVFRFKQWCLSCPRMIWLQNPAEAKLHRCFHFTNL